MSSELVGESTEDDAPIDRDRDRLVARTLAERFTRLRAAHRALPSTASDLQERNDRESRAESLRAELMQLLETQGSPEQIAAARQPLASRLDVMEEELLRRFDLIEFVSLRATIPRSVESHRREVIALLEALLEAREGLIKRLSKVEYLITMLSTEEVEGRRNIKHDPVRLTPMLEDFSVEGLDPSEADTIAGELFQIAALDVDTESPIRVLRSVRSRKESIGLGCLCPNVIRAIVTYNVRMFNHVECAADVSRASDEMLDRLFGSEVCPEEPEESPKASPGIPVERPRIEQSVSRETTSVFESRELCVVIDALSRRLRGVSIGSCTSERIALILDIGTLEKIERDALKSVERNPLERLLACTVVVGLVLRDMGAVESQFLELGVSIQDLSPSWMRELNARLGEVVSQNLTSDYELSSKLSGIKAKHFLTPMSRLNAKQRESAGAGEAGTVKTRDVAFDAPLEAKPSEKARQTAAESFGLAGFRQWAVEAMERLAAPVAAMALIILLGFLVAYRMGPPKSTVGILDSADLSTLSRFVESAYRSEAGRGPLLIGRVQPAFAELGQNRQIEEANKLSARLEGIGVREAMLYDSQGRLRVHYADGDLRRPAPLRVATNGSARK